MSGTKWQRFKVELDKRYKPAQRDAIAKDIVDFIQNRSRNQKDKDNIKFKKYSKEYINSSQFKNAKKNPKVVDLQLSGEMLAVLDKIRDKNGEVIIGFDRSDDLNNGKATALKTGKYGKSVGPVRDFMGIKKSDLDKILAKYKLKDKPDGD